MKSFSVLTVSKRTGWEKLGVSSVDSQTATPKEWIVVGEGDRENYQDLFKCKAQVIYRPAPYQIRLSNLNASLNAGLKHISSDYVIFYQDFIDLKENCFEKLLALADEKTFVTTCTPNYDGSDDGRYTGLDGPRPCRPEEWEANVAIAPMSVLRSLGGFEEELDNGWSWDNVHLAQRAAILGCRFILDESNRPKLLPHEQISKLDLPLNADFCARDIKAIREGGKPLRLKYL